MPEHTPPAQIDVLTIKEVSRRLGVSAATAYRAAARNEFPVMKLGRRLVIPRPAFERWLETGALLQGQGQS